ncbi:MAG: MBL fold metallo-hydrolase [Desulfomonilaceae bacterium]|jgi:glyoxylase-like metal-dependent hydrolase (beta-lactamase superfamily II)
MLIEQIQIGGFEIFCYVLGDEKTGIGIVVDPGGAAGPILNRANGKGIKQITHIVNTHSHVDHVSGNKEAQEATSAAIAIHELDAADLTHPNLGMLAMFGAEPSPPPSILLKDNDIIAFGNESVRVIHTPGHTLGGICLYFDGHVITGDTLFVGGIGRTDLPGGSYETLRKSIKERLFTLPDETIVLPGHNYGTTPTSTIAREKKENVFV